MNRAGDFSQGGQVRVAAADPRQARCGLLTRSVADPEGGGQVGAALRRVALIRAIQHFRPRRPVCHTKTAPVFGVLGTLRAS